MAVNADSPADPENEKGAMLHVHLHRQSLPKENHFSLLAAAAAVLSSFLTMRTDTAPPPRRLPERGDNAG
jgi:hypothetical protein